MTIYYTNNNGSRWVVIPKEKVLVISAEDRYCKTLTIDHYESFGNFVVTCIRYKGQYIKGFTQDCNGRQVFFPNSRDGDKF